MEEKHLVKSVDRGGRPSKLTPERQEAIMIVLRSGATRAAAAAACKIAISTLEEWCRRFPSFRDAVEQAEHEAELMFVARIRQAATEAEIIEQFDNRGNLVSRRTRRDWKAAAWWLERMRPGYIRAPQKLEVSGPGGGAIESKLGVVVWRPDEEWLRGALMSERELPPHVRIVEPAGPDPAQPGPLLLPESVQRAAADPETSGVPESSEHP